MRNSFGWLLGILALVATLPVSALEFNKYHSQQELNDYLRNLAKDYPALVSFYRLGESDKGLELNYVTITTADAHAAPAIYLNGTHHGDEKSSTETVLAVIDHLVSHRERADVSAILKKYVIIAQPIVNADGHRANTRGDAFGRDPNRDYAYLGGNDQKAFKISFIGLVRDLLAQFKVRAAVTYHSGMLGVLWPWCSTKDSTPLHDTFHTLSKTAALAMGMDYFRQSYFDYPTNGEFIEFAYLKHGTLGVTFEVSTSKTPPVSQLPGVVQRGVAGTLAYIEAVKALDEGKLVIEPANRSPLVHQDFNPLFVKLGRRVE